MPEETLARQERAAHNQALFREVNERLEELDDSLGRTQLQPLVCECASTDCVEPIELTRDEYEDVRKDGARFAVARGHVFPEVERLVGETDRYTVVEKIERAAELAQAHDPRAHG